MKQALKYFFIYLGLMLLGAVLFLFPALIIEIITSQGFLSSDGEISLWGMAFIMIGSQILPLIVFWKQKWCDYSFIKGVNYKKLLLLLALGWLGCVLVDACVQAYAPRFDWDTDILSSIEGMSTNPLWRHRTQTAGKGLEPLLGHRDFGSAVRAHAHELDSGHYRPHPGPVPGLGLLPHPQHLALHLCSCVEQYRFHCPQSYA